MVKKEKDPEKTEIDFVKIKSAIEKKLKKRKEGTTAEKPTISLKTGKVMEGNPSEMPKKSNIERVPTGISGLDSEINGGYVKKSAILVAGSPGAGKSIFGIQFIVKGIMEYGEKGVYVSFEEEKDNFYKYMLEFGWDLAKLEKAGKFAFVRYTPEQVNRLLAEGGGEIDNMVRKLKAKRLVIDSISAFALLYKNELAKRESLLSLFEIISKWGCTTLFTAEQEAEPVRHEPSVVEFEVDGVILLYNYRKGNIRQRVAEILKMRGTNFTQKIFPMRITDTGIKFYPEEEAF
jgi:circadian clock protein KaiC